LASLGHPSTFEWVLRLCSVTAWHSSSGHQPNFAALNRERHLFGRVAVTLGISPHSSLIIQSEYILCYDKEMAHYREKIVVHSDFIIVLHLHIFLLFC